VDCGVPEEIEHGKVNLASNATYYGVVALYECDKNFKIDGYERRMCLENGSWSHTAPKCHGMGRKISESTLMVNHILKKCHYIYPQKSTIFQRLFTVLKGHAYFTLDADPG
jgi:hypothetical protein